MRKSLGDKRREITPEGIDRILAQYDAFEASSTSKVFDGQEFGFSRLTVERPLRLQFQMTEARILAFGERFSHLFRAIQKLFAHFAEETHNDWNKVWASCQKQLKGTIPAWSAPEKKAFREVFTIAHPAAEPVIKNKNDPHPFEPDANLRDAENVPLKDDITEFFLREVLPHVPDAWIDETKTKIGYEINFNRHFYQPRTRESLREIDLKLKKSESRIMELLMGVTK